MLVSHKQHLNSRPLTAVKKEANCLWTLLEPVPIMGQSRSQDVSLRGVSVQAK